MDNIFNEQLIRRLPRPRDLLVKLLISVAAIAVMAVSFLFLDFFAVIIAAGAIAGAFFLFRLFEIEYEYILTDNELTVDKIVTQSRRKKLLSVDVNRFDVVAPFSEEFFGSFKALSQFEVTDASSHPASPNRWYATYRHENKSCLLIFEPNERLLAGIRQFIPRKIKGEK